MSGSGCPGLSFNVARDLADPKEGWPPSSGPPPAVCRGVGLGWVGSPTHRDSQSLDPMARELRVNPPIRATCRTLLRMSLIDRLRPPVEASLSYQGVYVLGAARCRTIRFSYHNVDRQVGSTKPSPKDCTMAPNLEAVQRQLARISAASKGAAEAYAASSNSSLADDELYVLAATAARDYVTISAPDDGRLEMRMILMTDHGLGGGSSKRLGNVIINVKKAFGHAADIVLASSAVVAMPWTLPFILISVAARLSDLISRDVSENDAMLAYVIWQSRDPANLIHSDLLTAFNAHLKAHGRPAVSQQSLDSSLEALENLGFIYRDRSRTGQPILRDFVIITYS